MKKLLLSISMFSMLIISSCTNKLEEIQSLSNGSKKAIEIASVNSTSNALKNIQNYIKNGKFAGADTRTLKNITIDPYIIDGDTAMYIANYGNGWDLFSTDQRTPLIMASAESGNLDLNDENLPPAIKAYIYSIADEIHQLKQVENKDKTINPEWLKYPENMEDLALNKVANTRDQYEPGVGHWELIFSSQIGTPTVTESAKMTTTKWGQWSPWNTYIPYAKDTTANYIGPAGCNAVATAQYLYYFISVPLKLGRVKY